jgi:itaconyl-CoA hydratase
MCASSIKEGWVGRFYEDFQVGDIYRSRLGRTVTETDNIQFTLITNNTNQLHFNVDYARRTEFGRPLVNSALTLSIVAGLGVIDISENGFALGWEYIRLPHPVFPGDTLYSESEVIGVRESKSRPSQGVVTVRTRGLNQEGIVVIEYERAVMVWKKAHAPLAGSFPTIAAKPPRTDAGEGSSR